MKNMLKFPIRTFNLSKVPWKWLAALLLTVVLVYGLLFIWDELTRVPPLDDVQQSLAKTQNAGSYRYYALAKRTLDQEEYIISDLKGEKNHQGVHLKGSIPLIKAELEIYQFPDAIYRRDSLTEGWLEVPSQGRTAIEQLIAEVNPLGIFYFDSNAAVRYAGKERVGPYTCRVYEVMVKGQNKFLEFYWQDFSYRLWVDRKDGFIRKAEVTAEHRDDSRHILFLSVLLDDYNEQFEIQRPQI